jgi:tape measure domain-containing protein
MADKKTLELQIKLMAQQAADQIKAFASDIKAASQNAKSFSSDAKTMAATVGSMQQEAQRAANSFKLFGGSVSDLRTQQAKMKSAILDLIDQGLKPESDEVQNLVDQYEKLDSAIAKAEKSQKNMENQSKGFSSALQNMNNMALGVAGAIGGAGLASIKFAGELEQTQLALEVLLGDAQQATKIKDEWTALAAETPFNSADIDSAGKKLLAFGVGADDVTESLRRIGDISAATGSSISDIADIYGKAKVQGRLFAEDINQFQGRGIPVVQSLAKVLGVAENNVKDLVAEGKVGFPELEKAFRDMTSEGGQFSGMMEKLSTSTMGQFSSLMDNAQLTLAKFGQMLLPLANNAMEAISGILEKIQAMDSGTQRATLVTAGLIAAFAAAIPVVNSLAGAMAFLAANPIVAGIAAAAVAVAAIAGAAAKAANAYKDYNTELQKTKTSAEQLLASYADGNTAKQLDEAATHDLIKLYPELRGEVSAYATTVEEASEAVKRLTEQKVLESAAAQLEKLREVDLNRSEAFARRNNIQQRYDEFQNDPMRAMNWAEGDVLVTQLQGAEAEVDRLSQKSTQMREQIQAALASIGYQLSGYSIIELPVTLAADTIPQEVEQIAATVESAVPPDFGREWQDKILQGAEKIIREREKAIKALEEKGTASFGINFSSNTEYKAELAALMEYYQRELDKLNEKAPAALFTDEWTRKNLDELQKLERDYQDSIEKLNKAAKDSFGESWATNEAYLKEAAQLEKWYANERIRIEEEIARKQREELINRHQTRMNHLKEEAQYQAAMGLQQAEAGNASGLAQIAVGTVSESVAGSQLGSAAVSAVSGMESGGILGAALGPIGQFAEALINAVMSLESVQKVLNIFDTILTPMMVVIEPFINGILKPVIDLLETLGDTLGKLLSPILAVVQVMASLNPVLKMLEGVLGVLGNAVEWLYMQVIYPVGNGIIDVVNGIIDMLNKIPMVDIKKLDRLAAIGDAAEGMAKEMERQAERIRLMYERQKSAVEDQLKSQLEALSSQYELGLISRDEYEKQAEKYASAADNELIAINERMEEHLAKIEEFTGAGLTEEQWTNLYNQADETEKQSYMEKWGEKVPVLGHLAGAMADTGKAIWEGIKGAGKAVADWVNSWWPFDTGSTFVPQDMPAMVHKGETIVPRTFADGIRSGELALVGRNNSAGGSGSASPIYVTVNVGGSVLSERDLVDAVHRGISDGIASRRLSPLPA